MRPSLHMLLDAVWWEDCARDYELRTRRVTWWSLRFECYRADGLCSVIAKGRDAWYNNDETIRRRRRQLLAVKPPRAPIYWWDRTLPHGCDERAVACAWIAALLRAGAFNERGSLI